MVVQEIKGDCFDKKMSLYDATTNKEAQVNMNDKETK
jgi:hypothetical protein